MDNGAMFATGFALYGAWSLFRDIRWCARNWKRGAFHLGRATRGFIGPSKARPKRHSETPIGVGLDQRRPASQPLEPHPVEPPKPSEPAKPREPTGPELLAYVMDKSKTDRGQVLFDAIRDGKLELDADGRPQPVGAVKSKKRK